MEREGEKNVLTNKLFIGHENTLKECTGKYTHDPIIISSLMLSAVHSHTGNLYKPSPTSVNKRVKVLS